jgi:glucuronate isomerase
MDKGLRPYLEERINEIPIVDPHTHLKEDKLSGSLMEVATYHWVLSELHSVGMDYNELLLKPGLSEEEKLANYVPYFKKISNTASAWCVKKVFSDLYGFDEELDEKNYVKLLALAAKKTADPGWTEKVVQKTGIKRFVTSVGNKGTAIARSDFSLMVDLHYLFNPYMALDLEPWFSEFYKDESKYLDAIEKVGGKPVYNSRDLINNLESFLRSQITGRVKYFNCVIFSDFHFTEPDMLDVDRIIDRRNKGIKLDKRETDILIHFTTWNILRILDSIKATLQICVGAEYQICGGRSLSRYGPDWVSNMIKTCYVFPNIKFDFMSASRIMYHELAVAAKMIRNVHIQTMWWHTYTPSCMEDLYAWLEIVPLPKLGGFFCDAYYCEMTYAKLQMVKRALIDVLARKIENGIFTEDYALVVARNLLYENPVNLYGLSV